MRAGSETCGRVGEEAAMQAGRMLTDGGFPELAAAIARSMPEKKVAA